MPAEVKRASDAGFNAYVVKPIRVDDFLLKFDALLASRSGSAVMIAA
jgi:AmiR/NasT family two-component response regulator